MRLKPDKRGCCGVCCPAETSASSSGGVGAIVDCPSLIVPDSYKVEPKLNNDLVGW